MDVNASDYGTKIQSLAAENGEIATEMTLLTSQLRVDIHAKLTPLQQQKLADGAGRMRQHRDEHREKHRRAHDAEVEL